MQDLNSRMLILDGAMGTMLRRYDTDSRFTGEWAPYRSCKDLLALVAPDILEDIHRQYLQAGADIISTNTFNTNAISLAEERLAHRVYDMARASAAVARRVADEFSAPGRRRYVAGSMGPTNRTLSMSARVDDPASREVTFEQMRDAYAEQARGLIDGGADLLLVETVFDTLNAKAALSGIRAVSADIPVIVSATVADASGRLLSGQTVEAFVASVEHARPLALGLNCGFGARHLLPYLRRLARAAKVAVSVHPNAGLPNVDGGYDETPAMFASDVEEYFREGLVNIVGGCCGTTPEHIAAIAPLSDRYAPRIVPPADNILVVCGLEPLAFTTDTNFVNVGERTNVAGSAKFARLIREGNFDEALSIAIAQVEAGAQVVDVCMDDAMIDGAAAMCHFLNLMASEPAVARVPVMIDSSKWEVIEAGLRSTQGKSIVNSISLKEGEETFLKRARSIRDYGAAAVVMLFDERGQADTFERKIEVAARAYRLLTGIGFPPEDIIFDPNILAVATGMPEHDVYAKAFIDATAWIKRNLPFAKVSGGVSNLSFAFRGNNAVRKAMHAVFLYHAIKAGMDMAIVNPQMVQLYDDIEPELLGRIEDLVLYRREDAADRLIEYARSLSADTGRDSAPSPAPLAWRKDSCSQRIAHALLSGDTGFIAADAVEAYRLTGNAVEVINTMLMPAMERVGELFGQGKMFLPQVVKSARVMKQAVQALRPFMASDGDVASSSAAHRIVLATVKGDVHDIGKNIVGIVQACDGYQVADLGVMVAPETIVDEAVSRNASAICLSGLITPSLDEMIHVAEEVERRGLSIPIVVGGATTSALHTAVKIAPVTKAPVVHSRDAAHNVSVLRALLGPDSQGYVERLRLEQQRLRDEFYGRGAGQEDVHMPPRWSVPAERYGTRTVLSPSIGDVEPYINWDFFFAGWELPGKMPDIFSHPGRGQEARRIYDDARKMLAEMEADGSIRLRGVVWTCGASTDGDDVVIHAEGGDRRLPMPHVARAMREARDGAREVTLFALTAGEGLDSLSSRYREAGDDYSAIMAKLLCDRLAEAFAEMCLQGGCRIAIGYPAAPDHRLKRDIFDILGVEMSTEMRLTESCMIVPGESVCGLRF